MRRNWAQNILLQIPCAVAADNNSVEMFYFIYIEDACETEFNVMDDYNHLVVAGQKYISGFYREKKLKPLKVLLTQLTQRKMFISTQKQ